MVRSKCSHHFPIIIHKKWMISTLKMFFLRYCDPERVKLKNIKKAQFLSLDLDLSVLKSKGSHHFPIIIYKKWMISTLKVFFLRYIDREKFKLKNRKNAQFLSLDLDLSVLKSKDSHHFPIIIHKKWMISTLILWI